MSTRDTTRTLTLAAAAAGGAAAGVYAVHVAATWARFGRPSPSGVEAHDDLLDRFMPRYDVVDRHAARVAAPAAVALQRARLMEIYRTPLVRAIFFGRELLFGRPATAPPSSRGLIADMRAIGWGVLADVPDREIVMGAYTKPWEAEPAFHAVAPGDFAAFDGPGVVKIVWTLRADPVDDHSSIFRTETRAVATDAEARRLFRWYWAFLSPGIVLIRRGLVAALRCDIARAAASGAAIRLVKGPTHAPR